ncbi:chain length determinant protein EpsF [Crenothrix polyspora]|jgi:polysaccharide biosynthesis transport protein|uniref:Chain length determinant protein EpsF n=1 Tax=Crenothrix polyspora TaxID=360316 RepID=A0A1R4HEA0_9GAMM|nr:chain length determinant protein EpsF [Crenothrix polyspora]SJM94565.1 Chain length determinant protein EpsF [Crenothrix polyspora]
MNFQQILIILYSRKYLIITILLLTVGTITALTLRMPKQYIATASLVVDQWNVDPVSGASIASQVASSYLGTQVDIITSHNVAVKVVDMLRLTENTLLAKGFDAKHYKGDMRDWVAEHLIKHLEVLPSRESSVIKLNFSAKDPQLSADVSNAFAKAYIDTNIELRAQPARQNADWFDEQLSFFRERLEQAQNKLSDYQQKHGIVVMSEKVDLENDRLAEISKQLVDSQSHTYEMLSRKNQLLLSKRKRQFESPAQKGDSYESIEEVLSSTFVQTLKGDLARAEAKFAEVSKRVDKNHPQYKQAYAEMISLKDKIDQEINTVLESIGNNATTAQQRDERLLSALGDQKEKVLQLKQQQNEISVLNREVENAQKFYDNAMQRSVQTRMESEASQSNIAILNPALMPQNSAKPNVTLNILLSVFLGTLLGIGMAFIAELLDRRLRSPIDMAEQLGVPVLGVLSAQKKRKSLFASKRSVL